MDILVYEHIDGLPEFLDAVEEELTDYITEHFDDIPSAEKYIDEINGIVQLDKYGRKRRFYIWRK